MTVSIGGVPGEQAPHVPTNNTPSNQPSPQTDTSQQPQQQAVNDAAENEQQPEKQPEPEELPEIQINENGEPVFPIAELARLDEMINRTRWVVPVLPKGELEVLLEAAVRLTRAGLDIKSEPCQRFFRDGLTTSFHKILNDEAVNQWKFEIHKSILKNTEKLIEICVIKLSEDWFPLLDLLALAFNPHARFHVYNSCRPSETVSQGVPTCANPFAKPPDARNPKGWLVDLVNHFGELKGFDILQKRITEGGSLSVPLIAALIRPFGNCAEVLTPKTVEQYFLPVIDMIPKFVESLTDDELKKESKTEMKNDALSSIIKALKHLSLRVSIKEDLAKQLETFRLKMILRLLQISSFNGKMNALNEINKVVTNVSYHSQRDRHSPGDEEEWLTAERMADWIQQNKVLSIVLKDNLHQPQYVEKLEKILRFVIKEKALTLGDLDNIWDAQVGKHDAIVKNIHDLLAKLAWDFSAEQLDHLFKRFQESWANASKKQREKLLELIRRLAEDDKEGVMAHKVLGLLWNLAHSDDVPTDIMDLALTAHIKILDYSCSQDRDSQKTQWIDRCVEELRNDTWVLPALKQIREICMLFYEAPQNYSHTQRSPHVYYRHEVINQLQQTHKLVTLVPENLASYMEKVRKLSEANPEMSPEELLPDGRYNHLQQVQDRLNFLRFLLKDGQLWLCAPEAKLIWQCLAENAVFSSDREACFKWFAKLMGEEPDLDPEISRDFFENNVMKLDPALLTENGIRCFERFFRGVNVKEKKLIAKRRNYLMDDVELIGVDYMWQVVLRSSDDIASRAIEYLKETFTNLGPQLRANQVEIHENFIKTCIERIKESYDILTKLDKENNKVEPDQKKLIQEATKIVRCLTVLCEYVAECDDNHLEERFIVPHGRSCRGKHITLIIRFPAHGRQGDDFEIWSHTNESLAAVRRHILNRIRASSQTTRVDLYVNGELLCPQDDRRLVSQLPIRDRTLITAKIGPVNNSTPSSPDSSSDSSTGSNPGPFDGEAEKCLPGVIMSTRRDLTSYFFAIADYGIEHDIPELRETVAHLLNLIPSDKHAVEQIKGLCEENSKVGNKAITPDLESLFFSPSPTQVLFNLEIVYCLLMPASQPLAEPAFRFQNDFVKCGGIPAIINALTNTAFLECADPITRRSAYCSVMKIAKLLFTSIGYGQVAIVAEAIHPDNQTAGSTPTISASVHNAAVILQQALQHVPNPGSECTLRNVAVRLGPHTKDDTKAHIPDLSVVKAVQKIAWSSSGGALHLAQSASNDEIHKVYEKPVNNSMDHDDEQLAKESIEVLTVCLALCPSSLESLSKDKSWQCFIIDLLILCHSRIIRLAAAEQFFLMATRCSQGHRPLVFFITLLFTVLMNSVKDHAESSSEYFNLLCKLLNYAFVTHCPLPTAEVLLNNEIQWLKRTKDTILSSQDSSVIEEALLEGHLGIARELLLFQTTQKKFNIGSESGGANLVRELVEDFIFPASKVVMEARNNSSEAWNKDVTAVCSTSGTMVAGFDLLVALCTGCVQNMTILADMLIEMYYSEKEPALMDWEFIPPVGPRPHKGFVGLKNGGATCYMNSVIQQLFMIPEIKQDLLKAEGAVKEGDEEFLEGDEKMEPEQELSVEQISLSDDKEISLQDKEQERKEYQTNILRQLQFIFGHLAQSRLQFHIPVGFWKTFRLLGEPVNLREQHDALEFFNSLIDNLDEGLKTLGGEALLSNILGGSFADQKICKDCPHRYSRESPFLALNVDIRNHQHLLESMEQFVKGDLLEGANAYYCEKCDKKVDTVKRLCIKKFPKVLAIQLKRFDYDWERECAVKFNDYFEFPREFDMEPYTVQGLAKIEGEEIEDDRDGNDSGKNVESDRPGSTKYRLVGVLVHSGQASGGHYYAYILQRSANPANNKWYKFDDGDVTECKMDDNEEMKNQCFGGEYMGEVFDHMLKRMQFRRQKRWWNAYILFYERLDIMEKTNRIDSRKFLKMPTPIEKSVRKQNIQFLHNRTQFCSEFFQFMRKLVTVNAGQEANLDSEELHMISIQLVSKFLFTTGFHSKKTVRGPANEWFDAVSTLLRHSKSIRSWFAQTVLFQHQERFSEYLLECPIAEVRNAFAKIIVFLAHFSHQDGPCPAPLVQPEEQTNSTATLSDYLLKMVLNLLHKEVPEHGRHLQQYFQLFLMYAGLGAPERAQLLHLEVPATFVLVALDKGPGPPIKYQYAELGKLYSVVSQLIRSCDVTGRCMSSTQNAPPLPNCYGEGDQPIIKIQPQVAELVYNRTGYGNKYYVKKLIEDYTTADETLKLLRFTCWENPHFSRIVLSELLWQVAYSYTYELRPYLDCLLQMLLLQDSWQTHRIHNTLRGIPDEERDGLFETIQRSKNHYQKRAYQCIKFMVTLFASCPVAHQILLSNSELKRRWQWAVEWLGDELERRPYSAGASYTYNNWSPPAQSNETSNGYFLERSHSARLTLAKACELCPEEEQEELEGDVDNGISPIDSPESAQQQSTAQPYQPTPVYPQGQPGNSPPTEPPQGGQSPQEELFDVDDDISSDIREKAESE